MWLLPVAQLIGRITHQENKDILKLRWRIYVINYMVINDNALQELIIFKYYKILVNANSNTGLQKCISNTVK